MLKKNYIHLFLIATLSFFIIVFNIYAAKPAPPPGGGADGVGKLPKSAAETIGGFKARNLVADFVTRILPIILTLAGFFAVVVIIISGIQFVTSSGNPEAAAAAKNRLIYAIVGFIIIILAFSILQIVNKLFLGTTIT